MPLDFSHILGKKVKGIIDRPIGCTHLNRFSGLTYPVNYGYVEDVFAADSEEQDIYFLGTDHPLSTFEGVVIAVIHRLNDIEDKWIVAPEGMTFTDDEIIRQIEFMEKHFDIELYR
ncbi:inorganic pyrophosphatase [Mobilitalea sibirica]|uniref:Inorganic pyrophosphatase n=1 Tax=Mobilitalea sibirica TaxID=1462919 RepID=A0A8J7H448_9FIRM|nr:inorganic pyrophosphatase [Mobilitalea sibirica]MBH1942103.1 inorganic pyrophosphatase [Mobilitalea sibirica]